MPRQRRRRAGTLAERCTSLGIRGECHLMVARDARQYLGFDEVHVSIGDCVVFDGALPARTGREEYGDDRRNALLVDQVVEHDGPEWKIGPRFPSAAAGASSGTNDRPSCTTMKGAGVLGTYPAGT
jgi:hypothetical protein